MGLDFSHGDAHWAYSGFYRFRERLAAIYGVKLENMYGFDRPWAGYTNPNPIPWEKDTCGGVTELINHSDCDGYLSVTQCKRIAPALREAVKLWPDDDFDKQQALLLADGMDEAVKEGKRLEFC